MTDAVTCPQCGSELPSNAPAGICPRCLMQAALAESSDENQAQADSPFAVTTPQPRSFLPPDSGVLAGQFPQLEILELLGQGGMGAVYKARQPKLDRLVALKIIRPESADDPTFAERFNREAKTLARVSHPNIVAVYDFGEVTLSDDESGTNSKTLYYFLMEYVDGANLRQMMDREELSPDRALSIVPQICDALQFAHDEGIVHRDIKPENILIDSRGRVKIADFGLAKLAFPSEQDFTLTGTHQVMGTPRYMAPEQMAGSRAVDHRADLYSLGVVFYEMLTGQIAAGIFDPPSKSVAIDPRLDAVVMKTLAQKPDDRFQSAQEIRASLQAIAQEESVSELSEEGTLQPPPARGFSTIFEREIGAAWNWVVQPDRNSRASEQSATAAFPRLLFITLAVLGGLTIFLPWAALQIDKGTEIALTVFDDSSILTEPVRESFRGTEIWSSSAAAGACFLVALVLILTPHRRSPGWICVGLMSSLSIAAAVLIFTYPNELNSQAYVELRAEVTPETEKWVKPEREFAGVQAEDSADVPRKVISHTLSLWAFADRVKFREGYFGALGISLSLVLLNIIAVRNLILNREPHSETSESWSGTPLASLRFHVPVIGEIGSKVRFHFLGLGYELVDEQPGAWIFQRGTVMGGLMQTDIRDYPTRLSVHSIEEDRGSLVNCHWSVRMMGGWAGKKDIKRLEDEGRELETLLAGPAPEPVPLGGAESSVESRSAGPDVAGMPVAEKRQPESTAAGLDLVALEDEASGPAIAMTVVGFLMMVVHSIMFFVILANTHEAEISPTMIPGVLIGLGMLAGGLNLRHFRSRAWAQLGIIAGYIPLTPGWLLSFPICIWAQKLLNRTDVKQAFLERARRRRFPSIGQQGSASPTASELELFDIQEEVSGPAVGMMVVGLLMLIAHVVFMVFLLVNTYEAEISPVMIPGILIGLGMIVGGFHLKRLSSRGWVQLGIIAGFIPGSPGWLLSFPICIWAKTLLSREDVKQAFLKRARRKAPSIEPTHPARSPVARLDLLDMEEEVSSPAIGMIVVGLLTLIGHGIAVGYCLSHPWDRDVAWIGVPGMLVGLGMLVGGFSLKGLRSRSWAQLGIIAGFVPASPGWIITAWVSIWANSILHKPEVRQAFLERARRAGGQPEQNAFLRPAVFVAVTVWTLVVVLGGMAVYPWLRGELSEISIIDNRAGTLVPKSGAYKQVTVTSKGVGRTRLILDEDDVERRQLQFVLTPLKNAKYGGGTGLLEIELPNLGWRAPLRDGTEIGSSVGLTPDSVKEWMGLSGVDSNVEGVAEEARALFAIAEYAHQKPPHEMIDASLFEVQPGASRLIVDRYEEWVHARYCLYVWLAGMAIVLLIAVPRGETAPNSLGRTLVQFATMIMILAGVSFVLYLARGGSTTRMTPRETGIATKPAEPGDELENPLPPLHAAAASGQIGRIRQLLQEAGTDINDKDSQGKTPLMYAAENNQTSTVLALVVMGANINETDPDGRNAVMLAADNGHADLIAALKDLENFAAICHRDDATPEQAAEKFKEFPGVDRRLLEEVNPRALNFEVPLEAQDKQGMTVAMIAAANGDIECLETLWNMGGIGNDVRQDRLGRTLMMHAMSNGHTDLVQKFLARFVKTDPEELSPVDRQGQTLYSLARQRGLTEVADRMRQLLEEEVERYTKLAETEPNYRPYLTRLLKALETTEATATEPPATDEAASDSTSKLHAAAATGDSGLVKQLLDAGASVNDKDSEGRTPLMVAAANGHASLAATLMLLGANVNEQDKQGMTPMMYAVENGHEPVRKAIEEVVSASRYYKKEERIEKLRKLPGIDKRLIAGIEIDVENIEFNPLAQDNNGETVLMKAVKSQNFAYLRDAKYNHGEVKTYEVPPLQDNDGRTALMHAILLKDPDLIRRIYEVNLDYVYINEMNGFIPDYKVNPMFDPRALSRSDKESLTALQLAQQLGMDETAKLIREEMERFVEIATRSIDNEEVKTKYRPQWSNWLTLRGHAYLALGEKEKAEADFREAEKPSQE